MTGETARATRATERPDSTGHSRAGLEAYVRQIAPFFSSQEGAIVLGLLRELRDECGGATEGDRVRTAPGRSRVGIWQDDGAGSYRRIPGADAAHSYADVDTIPVRASAMHRIVLVGESVARAFFFDPALTVAQLLEASLRQAIVDLDVVDLASSGQTLAESLALIEQSALLQPSAIVVFGGNNWIFEPVSYLDAVCMRQAIAEGRYREARAHHNAVIRLYVREFFEVFSAFLRSRNISGVFVLPEFNLLDHVDQASEFVPVCPDNAPQEWSAARKCAEDAVAAGRLSDAQRAAEALVAMDVGSHPAGHRLLAECARLRGDAHAAYEHLACARDATTWIPQLCTPRCPTAIQAEIRACCNASNITLVDLCGVFGSVQSIPDRRLFMDYCHLSAEGLRLATEAIVGTLTPLLNPAVRPPSVPCGGRHCDSADEAIAHFLAAVHNAQAGGSLALSEYHCRTALALSPEVAGRMMEFVAFNTAGCPPWMCGAYHHLLELRTARRYFHVRSRMAGGHLAFLELIRRCIREECPDCDIGPEPQYSTLMRRGDVADALAFRRAFTIDRILPQTTFVRARTPRSTFTVFADTPPRRATIVWRAPVDDRATACVSLNGRAWQHLDVTGDWTEVRVDFGQQAGGPGRSELTIVWPPGVQRWVSRLDINERRGVLADPYHTFGEIQHLTIGS